MGRSTENSIGNEAIGRNFSHNSVGQTQRNKSKGKVQCSMQWSCSVTCRGVAMQHVVVLQCNKQHKVWTADSRTVGLKKHKGEAEAAAYNREYL